MMGKLYSKICLTNNITHCFIKENLYNDMLFCVDKNDIQIIITNLFECVDFIKKDFGNSSKIIGIPLTSTENHIFQMLYRDKKVDFVIFNDNENIDKYIKYIQKELNKLDNGMNKIFKNSFFIMNPPYQGINRNQIYPKFWNFAIKSGFEQISMIFPSKWQEPTNGSGLSLMNKKEIKEDKHIVYINNISGVFDGVSGANNVNIILWKKNYNNGLNGFQKIYTNGKNEEIKKILIDENDKNKLKEVDELVKVIKSCGNFKSISCETTYNPYLLRTDFLENPEKYGHSKIDMTNVVYLDETYERENNGNICIFGRYNNRKCFVSIDENYDIFNHITDKRYNKIKKSTKKYKVFIPKSWGNNSGDYGKCGGSYSFIVLGYPFDICTEIYLESCSFDTLFEAQCHSKYIMSKFTRFLLLDKKNGTANSKSWWESIPKQDYKEDWWKEDDISIIDEHLFEKYSVPEYIREFIRNNVQPKTINDIKNYNNKNYNKIIIKYKNKKEENPLCPLWN